MILTYGCVLQSNLSWSSASMQFYFLQLYIHTYVCAYVHTYINYLQCGAFVVVLHTFVFPLIFSRQPQQCNSSSGKRFIALPLMQTHVNCYCSMRHHCKQCNFRIQMSIKHIEFAWMPPQSVSRSPVRPLANTSVGMNIHSFFT